MATPRTASGGLPPHGLGEPVPATIAEKRRMLLAHGIALWDVIASCDIVGSSDASIRNVRPADIGRVTGVAPIERVVCNGAAAGRLYRRHLEPVTGLLATVLPSTSPGQRRVSLDRLIGRWSQELG